MSKFIIIFLIFTFNHDHLLAQKSKLDQSLAYYIDMFKFEPVKRMRGRNELKYKVGKALFADKILSYNRNISCLSCHNPKLGTGDGLPLSLGTGAIHTPGKMRLHNGHIIARNSPPLYNKGHKEFKIMFADMRILYNEFDNSYITPEPKLNGVNPDYKDIKDALTGPLAAQALFPITDPFEMLGTKARAYGNRHYWDLITKRVMSRPYYETSFAKLFPQKRINIGHIASVIAYFEALAFQAVNTPWDQYLRGDLKAMSDDEKKGALLFVRNGCATCHDGKHLTNFTMHNVGIPFIGPGKNRKGRDFGRYEVIQNKRFLYRFVTPPLRNLAKTAPYFHNGSMKTIREVIDHYDNPYESLSTYDGEKLLSRFQKNYQGKLKIVPGVELRKDLLRRLSGSLQKILKMSEEHKDLLELFLTKSLSDKTP